MQHDSLGLQLQAVTRRQAGRQIWAPLDLRLERGTLCVLTGPNGAGKTTLLRLAAGLLRPSTGKRLCAGNALYLRAGGGLRGAQSVLEAVQSAAGLVRRREHARTAIEGVDLAALAARRIGTLSGGERVRVSLAVALAVRPALLCLDEPTAALDDPGLRVLIHVVDRLRSDGVTVLVATHQPESLLPWADAHLELSAGRMWIR